MSRDAVVYLLTIIQTLVSSRLVVWRKTSNKGLDKTSLGSLATGQKK